MRSNFEKAYEPNPHKSPFTEVRFNEEKQIYEPLNPQLDRVARSLNAAWYGYRIRQTEVDELQKQLIEQGQRFNAQNQQIATLKWQLKRLGYTDNGGELMKPPIGDAPKFDLLDELQKRVEWLEDRLKATDTLSKMRAAVIGSFNSQEFNARTRRKMMILKRAEQALKGEGQ